jgi:hypothetical protein
MMLKKLSVMILLSVSVALGVESEARWKPVQPDSITDDQKALQVEKDADRRYQEAQTDLGNEKDPAKKKDIEMRLQQATYDKAVAQLQEANLAEAVGDTSSQNKQKRADAQKSLESAREKISNLTVDLGRRLEKQNIYNPETLLTEIGHQIQNIVAIAPNEPEKKYLSTLDTLESSFATGINTLIDVDGKALSDREKIEQLDKARSALVELRNGLQNTVDSKNKNTKIYNATDRIIKSLGLKLNTAVNKMLELTLSIDQKEPGFLKALVDKFLKWLKSFRTNPLVALSQSQFRAQQEGLRIMGAVVDFVDKTNWDMIYLDLTNPDSTKIKAAQDWLKRAKEISQTNINVDSITDLPNQIDNLSADIYAGYAQRYYDPTKYQTLFEQFYASYSDQLEKYGFSPDQAYQILGLTSDAPQSAIQAASEAKMKEKREAGITGRTPAEEAVNILSNPVSRQNYDTFLQDYKALKDAYTIDITKESMPVFRAYLKSSGQTEKLAISQSDFDKFIVLGTNISDVILRVKTSEKSDPQKLYNFNMQVSEMEKRLNEIKESRTP